MARRPIAGRRLDMVRKPNRAKVLTQGSRPVSRCPVRRQL